jgi:hypothetical protein
MSAILAPPSPPVPPDDLSGTGNAPELVARANAALTDSRHRTHYRTAATVCAFSVVALLCFILFCFVRAISLELSRVNNATVAIVASLVIAIAALTAVFLRATFSPAKEAEQESSPSLPLPSIELVKTAKETLEMFLKGTRP